jgi:hypothetical protein
MLGATKWENKTAPPTSTTPTMKNRTRDSLLIVLDNYQAKVNFSNIYKCRYRDTPEYHLS